MSRLPLSGAASGADKTGMSRRLAAGIALALALLPGAGCGHSSASQRSAWVVFASDRDGRWDVYAVHPDGTGLIRVTTRRWDMLPHVAASPDGNWLAIVTGARSIVFDRDGRRHLRPGGDAYAKALVDDNGKVGQVPAEGGSLRSPDGKFAVVVSERGEFRVVSARTRPAPPGRPTDDGSRSAFLREDRATTRSSTSPSRGPTPRGSGKSRSRSRAKARTTFRGRRTAGVSCSRAATRRTSGVSTWIRSGSPTATAPTRAH
ncbi:MAG: hypothetical protein E6G60_17670 [Actinobacteria bacterium]|nr:MAG: hypothetical protein E6G60_17670 [Actinomycetota bacterium]